MSSEWASKPLSEVIDIISGGTPKTSEPSYWGGSIPWLSVVDFNNENRYVTKAEKHITEAGLLKSATTMLQEGDIIISARGTVGALAQIGKPMAFNQSCYGIRGKNGLANTNFIYYILKHSVQKLKNVSHGAVFDTITRQTFDLIYVKLPSYQEQEKIAGILGCLDDRITLLRETNATLEAIAQAMFKSWFVDFDPVHAKQLGRTPEGMDEATALLFPDSFEESELGLVPEGWTVGVLADCCLRVESGGTPKRTIPEYWNGDVSWLTSGEVRNSIVFETKEKITYHGVNESSAKIWPEGTTIVAMYGATAGEVCLLAKPAAANQACCGLIPSTNSRAFLFFCTRRESKNLAAKSSGSAQQNLNKGLVSGHRIIIPTEQVLTAYESIAGELLHGWIENEQQAQTLASLRNTLLPRLISGRLHLPEAETMLDLA